MKTDSITQAKLFIGIDMHKRSWKVHCHTELFAGRSFSMNPDPFELFRFVQKHFKDHRVSVAYEAGCCGYSAHREFLAFGRNSCVVNPADIHRRGKERYTKTDRIDAQLISRELRDGRLSPIHVPDRKREELRALFRRRNEAVKALRRIKSSIKMQILFFGVDIPPEFDNEHWSHAFRRWLRKQEFFYGSAAEALRSRLRSLDFLDSEVRHLSNLLRAYCRKHHKTDYTLLRSLPGIGPIVACGILAELGDLRRFSSVKQLAGYLGLAPGIYQSGDTLRHKGMTPRAQRLMRSYFIEAAWQAVRSDPAMQAYYRKHSGKNSKSIIVKVARKLLSRTLAVIKSETPYQIGIIE